MPWVVLEIIDKFSVVHVYLCVHTLNSFTDLVIPSVASAVLTIVTENTAYAICMYFGLPVLHFSLCLDNMCTYICT